MDHSAQPDAFFIEQVMQGRPEAFTELVERYLPVARAVALAQTRNLDDADDVAQEALLKAYTSLGGLRDRRRFGAWLAKITRNLALSTLRRQARQAAITNSAQPATVLEPDVVQRELYAKVRAYVDELSPTLRETVLLHYFAGRKLREIAELHGVTQNAAEKRLSRARAALGARILEELMPEEQEGAKSGEVHKLMGLIAVAPPPWTALASAGLGAPPAMTALGGLIVTNKTVVGAALCMALALAVWVGLNALKEKEEQVVEREEVAGVSAEAQETVEPNVDSAAPIPRAESNTPERTPMIRRVARENQAQVTLPEEETDASADIAPSIQGRVVDEAGDPVAGAEVGAQANNVSRRRARLYSSARTRDDGEFRLEGLAVTGGIFMVATSTGLSSGDIGPLALTADGIQDLVVVLRPTGSLSGHVIDLDGRPVSEEGIQVELKYRRMGINHGDGLFDALDETGAFKIDNLTAGSYGLYINAHPRVFFSGIIRTLLTVELEAGEDLVGIELPFDYARHLEAKAALAALAVAPRPARRQEPKTVDVEGQVLRSDTHEPVERFRVRAQYSYFGRMRASDDTIADAKGRFSLKPRHGDAVEVLVESEGLAPGRAEFSVDENGTVSGAPLLVRLDPGAVVEGTVVDEGGAPVIGASIFVDFDFNIRSSGTGYLSGDRAAVTDSEGAFLLDALGSAPTTLYVQHPSFAPESAQVTPAQSRPTQTRIVMRDGGTIEGTVWLGGAVVRNKAMMLLNAGGKSVQTGGAQTDGDGLYRIEHLSPGVYTVYTSPNHNSSWTQFRLAEVRQGLTTQVDFADPAVPATLEGSVLLDGEIPASLEFQLEIQTEYGRDRVSNMGWIKTGAFLAEGLPPGMATLSLTAIDANHERVDVTEELEIAEGASIRKDFDLQTLE